MLTADGCSKPRRARPAGVQFSRIDAAVAVHLRGFEPLFDNGKIFVFIERFVMIAVGGSEFLAAQTAAQFLEIEGAVLVGVELVESFGWAFFASARSTVLSWSV